MATSSQQPLGCVMTSSMPSSHNRYEGALREVSPLPAGRVNAAINRMLGGARLAQTLWSENARRASARAASGASPQRALGTGPRDRLLQRYADRYPAQSMRNKWELTSRHLQQQLVDEVADSLRLELGLLDKTESPPPAIRYATAEQCGVRARGGSAVNRLSVSLSDLTLAGRDVNDIDASRRQAGFGDSRAHGSVGRRYQGRLDAGAAHGDHSTVTGHHTDRSPASPPLPTRSLPVSISTPPPPPSNAPRASSANTSSRRGNVRRRTQEVSRPSRETGRTQEVAGRTQEAGRSQEEAGGRSAATPHTPPPAMHPQSPQTRGGVPIVRSLSRTAEMIRDKRVPPMPSGPPPPPPPRRRPDDWAQEESENGPEEQEAAVQAVDNHNTIDQEIVPDTIDKKHLPLVRQKRIFEKQVAARLDERITAEDELSHGIRRSMERGTVGEKVACTLDAVQNVIRPSISVRPGGNRFYAVLVDMGKFHRRVSHTVSGHLVTIQGTTFGDDEHALRKEIGIEFPDSVVMEELYVRQVGPTVEMQVPFKKSELMSDLVNLVGKLDAEKSRDDVDHVVSDVTSVCSDVTNVTDVTDVTWVGEGRPVFPSTPPPPSPLSTKNPKPMRRRRKSAKSGTEFTTPQQLGDDNRSTEGGTHVSKNDQEFLNGKEERRATIESFVSGGDDLHEPRGADIVDSTNSEYSTDTSSLNHSQISINPSSYELPTQTESTVEMSEDFVTIRHLPVENTQEGAIHSNVYNNTHDPAKASNLTETGFIELVGDKKVPIESQVVAGGSVATAEINTQTSRGKAIDPWETSVVNKVHEIGVNERSETYTRLKKDPPCQSQKSSNKNFSNTVEIGGNTEMLEKGRKTANIDSDLVTIRAMTMDSDQRNKRQRNPRLVQGGKEEIHGQEKGFVLNKEKGSLEFRRSGDLDFATNPDAVFASSQEDVLTIPRSTECTTSTVDTADLEKDTHEKDRPQTERKMEGALDVLHLSYSPNPDDDKPKKIPESDHRHTQNHKKAYKHDISTLQKQVDLSEDNTDVNVVEPSEEKGDRLEQGDRTPEVQLSEMDTHKSVRHRDGRYPDINDESNTGYAFRNGGRSEPRRRRVRHENISQTIIRDEEDDVYYKRPVRVKDRRKVSGDKPGMVCASSEVRVLTLNTEDPHLGGKSPSHTPELHPDSDSKPSLTQPLSLPSKGRSLLTIQSRLHDTSKPHDKLHSHHDDKSLQTQPPHIHSESKPLQTPSLLNPDGRSKTMHTSPSQLHREQKPVQTSTLNTHISSKSSHLPLSHPHDEVRLTQTSPSNFNSENKAHTHSEGGPSLIPPQTSMSSAHNERDAQETIATESSSESKARQKSPTHTQSKSKPNGKLQTEIHSESKPLSKLQSHPHSENKPLDKMQSECYSENKPLEKLQSHPDSESKTLGKLQSEHHNEGKPLSKLLSHPDSEEKPHSKLQSHPDSESKPLDKLQPHSPSENRPLGKLQSELHNKNKAPGKLQSHSHSERKPHNKLQSHSHSESKPLDKLQSHSHSERKPLDKLQSHSHSESKPLSKLQSHSHSESKPLSKLQSHHHSESKPLNILQSELHSETKAPGKLQSHPHSDHKPLGKLQSELHIESNPSETPQLHTRSKAPQDGLQRGRPDRYELWSEKQNVKDTYKEVSGNRPQGRAHSQLLTHVRGRQEFPHTEGADTQRSLSTRHSGRLTDVRAGTDRPPSLSTQNKVVNLTLMFEKLGKAQATSAQRNLGRKGAVHQVK